MNIRVFPSELRGSISAPPSKSVMQRMVAGALLADGTSIVHNISQSDDCTAALQLAAQLGAEIEIGETSVKITGVGGKLHPRTKTLHVGESGLSARLFTAIAGLATPPLSIDGEKSLRGRPMDDLASVFEQLEGHLTTTNGSFPLHMQKGIRSGDASLNGSISSQFLTGLLFTLPNLSGNSSLFIQQLKSAPYVQLTLEILEDFGIHIDHDEGFQRFHIEGSQKFDPIETVVDGDWSGAAAIAVAGMLCASDSIGISGLDNQYTQADEAIRGALLFAGGALSGTEDGIQIARRPVRAFNLDLGESPDLFPVLAALAAHGKKPSRIQGIHRLYQKESNRAQAIQSEWEKFGIKVELDEASDSMVVHPRKEMMNEPMTIETYGDHRIAMATTILAMTGKNSVVIKDADCVAKSYPEFFDDLVMLGALLETAR